MSKPTTFVYLAGPMDGTVARQHWATTSTLYKVNGVVHRYRLRGTRNQPVLSLEGHRIMDHCKISTVIEPHRRDE